MSRTKIATLLVFTICAMVFGAQLYAQSASSEPRRANSGAKIFSNRRIILVPKQWASQGLTFDDVKDSMVFYSKDGGRTWLQSSAGLQPGKREGNPPFFAFIADDDGLFLFKFVRSGENKPGDGTDPDTTAYFDTTSPAIRPVSPREGAQFQTGQRVPIRFETQDANPLQNGLKVEYSSDNGTTWNLIQEDAPINEPLDWKHPFELPTTVKIRFTVQDRVGNSGTVEIQNVILGENGPRIVADRPKLKVTGPQPSNIIYYEDTDFYYEVTNETGSPTAYVAIWYTMDGGKTWKTGGTNHTGADKGKITVNFPIGFKRGSKGYGNYKQIGFYYQVVCEDGKANKDDCIASVSVAEETYAVDTTGPKLHLTSPSRGDKVYKGRIPDNPDSGKMSISWGGADKNLVPYNDKEGFYSGPVTVYYTSEPMSPNPRWTLLTSNLPIRFTLVKTVDWAPGDYKVKIVARDQMGNETVRESGYFTVVDGIGPYTKPETGINKYEVDRLWGLAVAYYERREYEKAVQYFDKAIEVAPQSKKAVIKHDRALAYWSNGDREKAIKEAQVLVANHPGNLTFQYELASFYHNSNKIDMARKHLIQIVDNDAAEPHIKARHLLAKIEFDRGNQTRAQQLWKSIKEHASQTSAEYYDAVANLKRYSDEGKEEDAEAETKG